MKTSGIRSRHVSSVAVRLGDSSPMDHRGPILTFDRLCIYAAIVVAAIGLNQIGWPAKPSYAVIFVVQCVVIGVGIWVIGREPGPAGGR